MEGRTCTICGGKPASLGVIMTTSPLTEGVSLLPKRREPHQASSFWGGGGEKTGHEEEYGLRGEKSEGNKW